MWLVKRRSRQRGLAVITALQTRRRLEHHQSNERAVAHLRSAFDMSERRACRIVGCARMTVRYRSRRPNDTELRARLRALAHERRRFGYRRLLVLLRWEGLKRLFRLYRDERL